MVLRIIKLYALIWNTRVEDEVYIVAKQPCNMTMGKLCRITLRFTWDRLNTHLIDGTVGIRREYNAVAKLLKENCPQREILIHV